MSVAASGGGALLHRRAARLWRRRARKPGEFFQDVRDRPPAHSRVTRLTSAARSSGRSADWSRVSSVQHSSTRVAVMAPSRTTRMGSTRVDDRRRRAAGPVRRRHEHASVGGQSTRAGTAPRGRPIRSRWSRSGHRPQAGERAGHGWSGTGNRDRSPLPRGLEARKALLEHRESNESGPGQNWSGQSSGSHPSSGPMSRLDVLERRGDDRMAALDVAALYNRTGRPTLLSEKGLTASPYSVSVGKATMCPRLPASGTAGSRSRGPQPATSNVNQRSAIMRVEARPGGRPFRCGGARRGRRRRRRPAAALDLFDAHSR